MAKFKINQTFILELSESEILDLICGLDYLVSNKNDIKDLPNGIGFENIEKIYKAIDISNE